MRGRSNTFKWVMELRVSTRHGDFRYQVRETMVVGPNDVWVLGPTEAPTLTLIMCYPFSYVVKAPRRFIVKAERVDQDAAQDTVAEVRKVEA